MTSFLLTASAICLYRWTGGAGEERYGLFPSDFVQLLSPEETLRLRESKKTNHAGQTCGGDIEKKHKSREKEKRRKKSKAATSKSKQGKQQKAERDKASSKEREREKSKARKDKKDPKKDKKEKEIVVCIALLKAVAAFQFLI